MQPDYAQRRRLIGAAAITLLIVAIYLIFGSDLRQQFDVGGADGGTENVLVITTPPVNPDQSVSESDLTANTDAMGTLPIGYLQSTETTITDSRPAIAVPRIGESLTATATFDELIDSTSECLVPGAPFGSRVNIRNIANGQIVACDNSVSPLSYPEREDPTEIIVHADTFATIASVTDSKIQVEVTW